ncbi:MAG: CGNR zinc finger domain-containing protein [Opitutae bacterium]|nr:CGNR zinc finger domain-containing protein [Opitutae bacterium]
MDNLAIDLANLLRWNPDGTPVDRLDLPEWFAPYARRLGAKTDDAALREQLRELRPLVRDWLEKLARRTGRASPGMLAGLNDWIGDVPVNCRLTVEHGRVVRQEQPAAHGARWLAAALGLELAELLTEYEPQRVKVCPNPLCRWVYYDETRGNIQRWCCYECGNRDKVARYRARLKKQTRRK